MAGCGNGEAEPEAQLSTPTVTPVASPTPGLSVQQVASKVAGIRAKNQKLMKDLEPCGLTASGAEAVACSFIVGRAPVEGRSR
jgi:hypothetical protein